MRIWLWIFLIVTPSLCFAQTKPLSPDWQAFYAEQKVRRDQGTAALDAEIAREKAGDCNDANTTQEINACYLRENPITFSNYEKYARAIGALLRLNEPDNVSNPKAPDLGKEFDQAEAAWVSYRKAVCQLQYDENIQGTIRGPAYGDCLQRVTRGHMHELAELYGDLWH